ncbi:hypothetical protein [Flavobacterium ustbae]|uniref:hypothetical protein n=1 Tax=Flavobacterium ustbae TaxID=2488790 RepID=UPI000F79E044|nr:hypothetical protein [Flavobacterium ustbae]
MAAIPDELYNVKFAAYLDSMKELYQLDEKFKDMCDAYCVSTAKTDFYKEKSEKSYRRKMKFETLSRELEEEILFYIMRNR